MATAHNTLIASSGATARRALFGSVAALLPVAGVASCQPVPAAAAPCPAAEIGRRLALAEQAQNKADEAWLAASPADKDAARCRFDALGAEVSGLVRALATVRATSLAGGMAQAMLAACQGDAGTEDDTLRAGSFAALMESVVNVLEAHSGTSREAMAGDYLMRRDLDGIRGRVGITVASSDAELVAMAEEVLVLLVVQKAKGEFPYDEMAEGDAKVAAKAENDFFRDGDTACKTVGRMCKMRAVSMKGVEAKARVVGMLIRASEGYDEEVARLSRSIAMDVERGLV